MQVQIRPPLPLILSSRSATRVMLTRHPTINLWLRLRLRPQHKAARRKHPARRAADRAAIVGEHPARMVQPRQVLAAATRVILQIMAQITTVIRPLETPTMRTRPVRLLAAEANLRLPALINRLPR